MNEKVGTRQTDQARPWLKGFVKSVGHAEAVRLLKDVGKLDPLPGATPVVYDVHMNETHEIFRLGEVVKANFQGYGDWLWGEISAVHNSAKGFYNVLYADDCHEEIGIFSDRLKREANTSKGLDHIPYFKKLRETWR